ncbi:hypothetical protein DMB92_03080 [Campylobacter sp. MIT 99-7217]|uniref:hypothetical protein n=1 Tax=Campylobacter sp. MIT 99-7217 TaxID=535091 RepID=UPI00115BA8F4|nr:hypothetical protein [Campylobacter sp. MIT 99-7217]TQR32960.1 hypothetical protein DMB92_03080 [Campylobacter sp. MIT 99-7217]
MSLENSHSAVSRIKNHLAYKLGPILIKTDKEARGGGIAYLILPLKLFLAKQTHKKELKLYQKIVSVFPSLKYPDLKTCYDYNEAK